MKNTKRFAIGRPVTYPTLGRAIALALTVVGGGCATPSAPESEPKLQLLRFEDTRDPDGPPYRSAVYAGPVLADMMTSGQINTINLTLPLSPGDRHSFLISSSAAELGEPSRALIIRQDRASYSLTLIDADNGPVAETSSTANPRIDDPDTGIAISLITDASIVPFGPTSAILIGPASGKEGPGYVFGFVQGEGIAYLATPLVYDPSREGFVAASLIVSDDDPFDLLEEWDRPGERWVLIARPEPMRLTIGSHLEREAVSSLIIEAAPGAIMQRTVFWRGEEPACTFDDLERGKTTSRGTPTTILVCDVGG